MVTGKQKPTVDTKKRIKTYNNSSNKNNNSHRKAAKEGKTRELPKI